MPNCVGLSQMVSTCVLLLRPDLEKFSPQMRPRPSKRRLESVSRWEIRDQEYIPDRHVHIRNSCRIAQPSLLVCTLQSALLVAAAGAFMPLQRPSVRKYRCVTWDRFI